MLSHRTPPLLALYLLFAINTVNFFDRQVLPAVAEPIRHEWNISDAQLGWLAAAFTLLYAIVGVPLGMKCDVSSRTRILCWGLSIWSAMTFVSGMAKGFGSLFAARLGVGLGEAVCAPASVSLIGDLFPAERRARAMSVFMLGLPVGLALSYAVSGAIAQHYGWRSAFYIAGIAGSILVFALIFMQEPPRGTAEGRPIGNLRRAGSAFSVILRIPTMRWIIVSGTIHNFNLYALGSFLPAFLVRHHRTDIQGAGFLSAIVIGAMGALGMVVGGRLGDFMIGRAANARMKLATAALALSLPAFTCAILLPSGRLSYFVLCLGFSYALMYSYYPLAYATIQDVIEPTLRATAMAIYFLAMYVLGASLGPVATGVLSDSLAHRAALLTDLPPVPVANLPDQFKAAGLQQAMYVIPILGLLIVAALAKASVTIGRDATALREWMEEVSPDAGAKTVAACPGSAPPNAGV
jgi:MFS family permease